MKPKKRIRRGALLRDRSGRGALLRDRSGRGALLRDRDGRFSRLSIFLFFLHFPSKSLYCNHFNLIFQNKIQYD